MTGPGDPASPSSPVRLGPVRFIRIGAHDPIPLDLPVYLGRRPRAPRIAGALPPRLVVVPSPSGEVSGTHLELRQQGSVVVVTDLGSANGTVVTSADGSPVRLRQGESIVVAGEGAVDVGDGIVVMVLP